MLYIFSRKSRHCSNWTTPSCMWREGEGTLVTCTQFSNAITSPGRALSMPGKRSELSLVVAALIPFVDSLGLLGIRLSTDGEFAVRVMVARMPSHRPRTTMDLAIVSRADLVVELNAPRRSVDMNYGMRVWPSHTVWLWMLRHAAWSRHRGGVHSCASTSRELPSPKKYPRDTVIWGVCVVLQGLVSHTRHGARKRRLRRADLHGTAGLKNFSLPTI